LEACKREGADRENALKARVERLQHNFDQESQTLRDERSANEKAVALLSRTLDEARRSAKKDIDDLRAKRLALEQRLTSESNAASIREREFAASVSKARKSERDAKQMAEEIQNLRSSLSQLQSSTALTMVTTASSPDLSQSSVLPPRPPPQASSVAAAAVAASSSSSNIVGTTSRNHAAERKIRAKAMRYIAQLRTQLTDAEAKNVADVAKEARRSKRYKVKLVETKRKYAKLRRVLDRTRQQKENLAREQRQRIEAETAMIRAEIIAKASSRDDAIIRGSNYEFAELKSAHVT
jgi:hypothetical protein